MAQESLELFAWDFPKRHTQSIRELLRPFLLYHKDVQNFLSLENGFNRLILHPRISAPADLPKLIKVSCDNLDGKPVHHKLEDLSKQLIDQIWTVVFFSNSKTSPALLPRLPETWQRVLSNFYPSQLAINGSGYWTVEHYFQSQKALCSSKPEMAYWFKIEHAGSKAVGPDPLAAKKAGSRKAYTLNEAELDMLAWESRRVEVMKRVIDLRFKQDLLFQEILLSTKKMHLLHFERSGANSFWGGNFARKTGLAVGSNQLGKIMMELRDREISR